MVHLNNDITIHANYCLHPRIPEVFIPDKELVPDVNVSLSKVPGGRMAELIGGKWLFGLGVLVTAAFTLVTPLAANTNLPLLYAVRQAEI